MNGTQFILVVTVFGTAFTVICIYFDKYRHKDPFFRKKLKQKRDRGRLQKEEEQRNERNRVRINPDVRNMPNHEAIILHEIQLAEGLMGLKQYEQAILHFANAIVICVDPCNILTALHKSLPPEAFMLLIEILTSTHGSEFARLQNDTRLKPILGSYAITYP